MLEEVYAAFTARLRTRSEEELARPSRAEAWTVRELLLHQLSDARRALVALATPAEGPADVDAVTYWRAFRPDVGDGGAAHARLVVRVAAAYDGTAGLLAEWDETSGAAARAAAAADPDALVATQGHVLTVRDLVSTLVVEATVHLLDAWAEPPSAALDHTLQVLERIHGGPLAPAPSPAEQVLQATGRAPSDHAAYPLLG
ncbi:maleylpyruvate isomerase N-terminal domain-containing protein [Nocardioides deserti]|uniref:Maleylpyruvate isomerase N-terminal domain-containing protein n=1 Tax=Nocardioides deserti TaxID=1588644 RepID=A0ABR6UEK2_9ACTN|nr:maleylpyruvate isomerase N-terminal domain-containing protein [Nocardioides deserti]MBC2962523.1 maleylpyruvate isomerase N-terminal domain-containing protein [Nocardioides deserti]GGO78960.1 maleylpyruvate isomerase [Nocardioides deserti]